jgi:hypothetical protein
MSAHDRPRHRYWVTVALDAYGQQDATVLAHGLATYCVNGKVIDAQPEGTLPLLSTYVEQIADMRSRAGDAARDCYTVVLGRLRALELIDEPTWREALDRPRVMRRG